MGITLSPWVVAGLIAGFLVAGAVIIESVFRLPGVGQLVYDSINNRDLIVINRWYPSSKTCSACGHLLAELSLSTRHWTCPSCGSRHDRDINAAKNILAAGQAVTACGAGVRHAGTSRVRSAVKQELQPTTAGIPVFRTRSSQEPPLAVRRAT